MVKTTEQSPFRELVRAIESKEMHLSFSALKAFCDSPRDFMAYKLRRTETTGAMAFGSAVHCLILEPDQFKKRYRVADKPDLRKKGNKLAWAAVLEHAAAKGLEVISTADYDQACRMRDFAMQDEGFRFALDQITQTEIPLNWKYRGYDWKGYADGIGESLYIDLKVINPLDRKKVRWRIRDDKLLWQGALYHMSRECRGKDFYLLCLSNDPNGMAIHFDAKAISAFTEEVDYIMDHFYRCELTNAWDEGHNFWAGRKKIFEWTDL